MNWFEAVANVWQGSRNDDAHRVVDERFLNLFVDEAREDTLAVVGRGHWACLRAAEGGKDNPQIYVFSGLSATKNAVANLLPIWDLAVIFGTRSPVAGNGHSADPWRPSPRSRRGARIQRVEADRKCGNPDPIRSPEREAVPTAPSSRFPPQRPSNPGSDQGRSQPLPAGISSFPRPV